MDKTINSTTTIILKKKDPKALNVFFIWYNELCRRLTIKPSIKPVKSKCQTILDFVAEKLKLEEWKLVNNALSHDASLHVIAISSRMGNCQFLFEVDTEEKAKKIEKKYGLIWTAFVLKQLIKSVSNCLKNTQVLTYLQFDGLPLFTQYLEPLLQALKKNKTVKILSFVNSPIEDVGCQLICCYLRSIPNIEILNISGCNLSSISGEYLAKLIKYQQINRYCESWHNSLRYEDPAFEKMCGLKRITINSNPNFKDSGLHFILDELEDDLWIKALDIQKCGLTENIAERILDIVQYNKVLQIVDLRQNHLISMPVIDKVFGILMQRQQFDLKPEFQWCATATTLIKPSVNSLNSKSSFEKLHKTKSAPVNKNMSDMNNSNLGLCIRKIKTLAKIQGNKSTELRTKVEKPNIQKRKETPSQLRLICQMKKLEIILPAISERKDLEQTVRVN